VRGHRRWYALEDRHQALFRGRLCAFVALAVLAAYLSEGNRDRGVALVAAAAAIALHALLRWVPERWPRRLRLAVDASLVVDAAAVFFLARVSDSSESLLLWSLPILAVAVTLGYSARTGMKAAILAAIVTLALEVIDHSDAELTRWNVVLLVMTGGLVATAAIFSSVNERELRSRSDRLTTLHEATAAFVGRDDPQALGTIARDAVAVLLPGWDVEVRIGVPDDDTGDEAERTWREDGRVHLQVPVLSGVSVPDRHSRLLGALVASRPEPKFGRSERLRGQQMVAVRTIVTTLAGALVQAELVRRLEELSIIDELTGLGNRRAFDAALREEMARAARTGQPLSLVLLDVDHFKRFNDEHGHLAGDVALEKVAKVVADSLRTEDRACRFGGEEFAVLLPATPEDAAIEVAERLRRAVASAELPHGPITISLGVADSDGSRGGWTLVRRADTRLYRAKGAGRNRVVGGDAPGSRQATDEGAITPSL
jgi:diguanylate cyclase (GGDEF)-like protein